MAGRRSLFGTVGQKSWHTCPVSKINQQSIRLELVKNCRPHVISQHMFSPTISRPSLLSMKLFIHSLAPSPKPVPIETYQRRGTLANRPTLLPDDVNVTDRLDSTSRLQIAAVVSLIGALIKCAAGCIIVHGATPYHGGEDLDVSCQQWVLDRAVGRTTHNIHFRCRRALMSLKINLVHILHKHEAAAFRDIQSGRNENVTRKGFPLTLA